MKEKKNTGLSLLIGGWLVFGLLLPLGLVVTIWLYRLAYWLAVSPIVS